MRDADATGVEGAAVIREELMIEGERYEIDMSKMELRNLSDPRNRISFKDIQDNGDHCLLLYDPKTKNAFKGTWGELQTRPDVKQIKLPAMIDLDLNQLASLMIKAQQKIKRKR